MSGNTGDSNFNSDPNFHFNLFEKTKITLWRRAPVNEFGIFEVSLEMKDFYVPYLEVLYVTADGKAFGECPDYTQVDPESGIITIPEDSHQMLFAAKEWLDREKVKQLCEMSQNAYWREMAIKIAKNRLLQKYKDELEKFIEEDIRELNDRLKNEKLRNEKLGNELKTHVEGSSRPQGDPNCKHEGTVVYNDDTMGGCGSTWEKMCESCGKVWN